RAVRSGGEAPARSEAAAARLRDDSQGGAHVQSARRARRDLGDRTSGLHRSHPHAVAAGGAGVLRLARRVGLSDARGGEGRLMSDTLIVELLTEELPPKALPRLGEAFAAGIEAGLRERGFLNKTSRAKSYVTPRRLAVSITGVRPVAPDSEVTDKLMPAKVARDALGQPSEALKKKLAGLGRPHLATGSLDAADGPDRIYVASDGKADYVYLRSLAKGQSLQRGLDESLVGAIEKMPI